jgi:uncharacterized protein (TIGR03437 family)
MLLFERLTIIPRPEITLRFVAAVAALFGCIGPIPAQQNILNQNLIVNGDAESGTAGTSGSPVASIPGWTRSGKTTVLGYGQTGYLLLTDPAPPDHQFQYFYSGDTGAGASTLTQTIDVSSGSATISAGNVTFTASAYLGGLAGAGRTAGVTVAFQNANGQTFSSSALGPISSPGPNGLTLQRAIGLVPAGTLHITVTLSFSGAGVAADSLSLVLSPSPAISLGTNLVVNPGAEAGPSAPPPGLPLYIPGWSTSGDVSVSPYGGAGWISPTDPGPPDRGVALFGKETPGNAIMYQDIDVSSQSSLIDANKANFQVSAYLGGIGGATSPTLVYTFSDWSGKPLAAVADLGPVTHSSSGLTLVSHSGLMPAGTRQIHIELDFLAGTDDGLTDNISFIVGSAAAPQIAPGGVVPIYSSATTIEAGSWVSIYGTNLAAGNAVWQGDFPTSLGGTSVTIDSRPAYLWFVSPTQINLQVPDDYATGTAPVTVTTAAGTFTTTVTLGAVAPSLSLFTAKYAAAIVATPGAPGNSAMGYDYIGPANAFTFPSRPVKAGETVLLYGVGFGPTTPTVAAGAIFSGAATANLMPRVTIGGVPAQVTFAGIIEAGLFQFNVVVPNAGSGDKLLQAMVGGAMTPGSVYLTLQ